MPALLEARSVTKTFGGGLLKGRVGTTAVSDLSLGIDSYSSIIGYQLIPANSTDCLIRRRGSSTVDLEELAPEMGPTELLKPNTVVRLRLKGKRIL